MLLLYCEPAIIIPLYYIRLRGPMCYHICNCPATKLVTH